MTQCLLPAELELGLVALHRPQKDRDTSQQYLAVPVLCKPHPTHSLKVFEKDYSGGEGKKGGFVMINLSGFNFLKNYSIFILIGETQFCRLECREN